MDNMDTARRAAPVRLRRRARLLVLVASVTVLLLVAAPARANVYVGVTPPTVPYEVASVTGVRHTPPPADSAPVAYLALTGGDILGLVALGGIALAAGLLLTGAGRRERSFAGRALLER